MKDHDKSGQREGEESAKQIQRVIEELSVQRMWARVRDQSPIRQAGVCHRRLESFVWNSHGTWEESDGEQFAELSELECQRLEDLAEESIKRELRNGLKQIRPDSLEDVRRNWTTHNGWNWFNSG